MQQGIMGFPKLTEQRHASSPIYLKGSLLACLNGTIQKLNNFDFIPKWLCKPKAHLILDRELVCCLLGMKMKTTEMENQWVCSVGLCITGVYGPSHEERSVFLQVPAMTRGVHPRDLEDPLFLENFTFVSIWTIKLVCAWCVCVCWRVCVSVHLLHWPIWALVSDRSWSVSPAMAASSFSRPALCPVSTNKIKHKHTVTKGGVAYKQNFRFFHT